MKWQFLFKMQSIRIPIHQLSAWLFAAVKWKSEGNVSVNPVKLGHILSWHYICTLNLGFIGAPQNLHLTYANGIHIIKMYSVYLTKDTFLIICFGMISFSQIYDTLSPTSRRKTCFFFRHTTCLPPFQISSC